MTPPDAAAATGSVDEDGPASGLIAWPVRAPASRNPTAPATPKRATRTAEAGAHGPAPFGRRMSARRRCHDGSSPPLARGERQTETLLSPGIPCAAGCLPCSPSGAYIRCSCAVIPGTPRPLPGRHLPRGKLPFASPHNIPLYQPPEASPMPARPWSQRDYRRRPKARGV